MSEGVIEKMKKTRIALAAIAVVALVGVIGAAGIVTASAQTTGQDPTVTPQPWGPSGMGHMWGNAAGAEGPLHDYLVAAFADALGLSTTDVEDRLAAGESLSAIAQAEGYSVEEFRTLFDEARQTAIDKAQADGVVLQQRAQSMLRLMDGTGPNGECPMWGDGDAANGQSGTPGMFGNRGGSQRQ
jgi:hypothetical protein